LFGLSRCQIDIPYVFFKEFRMSQSLYVGNFPYSTTEDELRAMCAEHGSVESVRIISDRNTGLSRGFGFVDMATEDEAQAVISALNGKDIGGRELKVNVSKPREERPKRDRW